MSASLINVTAAILYNADALSEGRGWEPDDTMILLVTLPFLAEQVTPGRVDHDALQRAMAETMFQTFNATPDNDPPSYAPRSMSVGDAVVLSYEVRGVRCLVGLTCCDSGWCMVPARKLLRWARV